MAQQESEVLPQVDQDDVNDLQQQGPSFWIKFMIGYLYFAQGFILSVSGTIPYVYPDLPDYLTLSLFSLSILPFSFKFITAPILQKYSSLQYGKRKTWILMSQILTNTSLFIGSFYTDLSQAHKFAIICFFMYFGLSLQDISLDALCLKQLRSAKLMSMIQAGCQSTGVIIGGLVLLKATSLQFAQKIGFNQPIANIQTLLIIVSVCMLISTILIHFRFIQTQVAADSKSTKISILKVYSVYKYFCKKDFRYCRTLIFFLVFNQGFNFFSAGYGYQLIDKGFSRDTMNTIDNVQNIILTLFVFLVGVKATNLGYKKTIMIIQTVGLIICFYLWIFFPISITPIIITNFISGFFSQWEFLTTSALCAYFPETGTTGMLYTMNASGSNFGKNLFIHTAILKKIPWRTASIVGLAFQIPLIFLFTPKIMDLIQSGQTKIDVLNEIEDQSIQLSKNSQQLVEESVGNV